MVVLWFALVFLGFPMIPLMVLYGLLWFADSFVCVRNVLVLLLLAFSWCYKETSLEQIDVVSRGSYQCGPFFHISLSAPYCML